jgi:hypothetical protein
LLEFTLISLFFYILLALTIDMGRMIYAAQVLQEAARVAARELAVTPLPAEYTFQCALNDPEVISRVFDPGRLVIDLDADPSPALPIVNQVLRPLMIPERDGTRNLLRYPGALREDADTPTGFTVAIPRVESRGPNGEETIRWVPVLEEVLRDPSDAASGSFSFLSPVNAGLVAVRLNYPFQAAAISSFRQNPEGPFEPNLNFPNLANDEGVIELDEAPPDPDDECLPASLGETIFDSGQTPGTYAGPYGLGRQFALGQAVRPYRKLLTAQAIFRREVFQ